MKFPKYLLLSSLFISTIHTLPAQAECDSSLCTSENRAVRQGPYVPVQNELPGILGLLAYRPETAKPLLELAQTLLVNDSSLSRGERELIAAYVSYLNQCNFCCDSHSAIAEHLLKENASIVAAIKEDLESANLHPKMKALLKIAAKVQKNARTVTDKDIALAREHGATDLEIHDTVLIAAAFCMYNRYVDGLATKPASNAQAYAAMGAQLATHGYVKK